MQKTTGFALILCFIVNLFPVIPGLCFFDHLSQQVHASPAVQGGFTACSLPVEMVNRVVKETTPITAGFTTSKSDTSDRQTAALGCFLIPSTISSIRGFCGNVLSAFRSDEMSVSPALLRSRGTAHHPPAVAGFLLLLMYFIVLSRSDLPWATAHVYVHQKSPNRK